MRLYLTFTQVSVEYFSTRLALFESMMLIHVVLEISLPVNICWKSIFFCPNNKMSWDTILLML